MTYLQLLKALQKLDMSQLDMDVTVDVDGDFFRVELLAISDDYDILDEGHPFLTIQREGE